MEEQRPTVELARLVPPRRTAEDRLLGLSCIYLPVLDPVGFDVDEPADDADATGKSVLEPTFRGGGRALGGEKEGGAAGRPRATLMDGWAGRGSHGRPMGSPC